MNIDVNVDARLENLFNIDINNLLEKALIQASLVVQNKAKDIAPYLSGSLKSSIGVDFSKLKQQYTIIGSRLPYARIRHFINKRNPQTLRYLFRGYEENEGNIKKIFDGVIGKVLK